jgi:DNA-binding response OmpR family regulator
LNPHRDLAVSYLLERVWEGDEEADEATVKLYVRYLQNKLEALGSGVVVVESNEGYRLEEGA